MTPGMFVFPPYFSPDLVVAELESLNGTTWQHGQINFLRYGFTILHLWRLLQTANRACVQVSSRPGVGVQTTERPAERATYRASRRGQPQAWHHCSYCDFRRLLRRWTDSDSALAFC